MTIKYRSIMLIAVLVLTAAWMGGCGGTAPVATEAPAPVATEAEAAAPTEAVAEPTEAVAAPTEAMAEATEAAAAPTEAAAAEAPSSDEALCGLGNGEAATGEPINVGAVVGATGPADFSSAAKGAAAYFNCVNANGGINGRPVNYIVEDDGWNPEQAAQVAAKLVNDDAVVALVGNTSFVECAANAKLYEDSNVIAIAGVGVPRECFYSTNIAPTNQGPRLSNLGMIQYAYETYGAKKITCMAPNVPGMAEWLCAGLAAWGADKGVTVENVFFDPATMDPTSLVLQAIASEPDAITISTPAPVAIPILKAAEEQDLREKFHWMGPTSLYDLAFPAAVGSYWDGYLDAQIELVNTDSTGVDNQTWLKILDEYGQASDPRDSFSQAGFLAAKIFTTAALKLDPATLDRASVTDAIREVTNFESDLLCGPWYFGDATLAMHNANHSGRIVQQVDGGWKTVSDCFEVEDPDLKPILDMEAKGGLVGEAAEGSAAPTEEAMAEAPTEEAAASGGLCGLDSGEAATGEPINVGAVVGATGPADFSSAAKGAAAYFNCVNANGGINGRPVNYIVEDDGWNPEQAAQVAAKLVNDDAVVALVGNTSFVECAANAKLYEDSNVIAVAGVGVPRECFYSTNIAPTNQGPRLSNLGMIQYAYETYAAKKITCMAPNVPGMAEWVCAGLAAWGADKGVTVENVFFDPATMDPTSLVLQAIASEPDAITISAPAPVAIPILKAAEEQDLREAYHWMGPTSLYDLTFPAAVGSYWDGYLDAQIELVNTDSTGVDNQTWLKILDEYGQTSDPRDSFSQAGFLAAKIFTTAALKLDPATLDRASVTDALREVTNFESDLLCGPWYFGDAAVAMHNANHSGRIVQQVDGGWKTVSDCFEVEDPDLKPILDMEAKGGLVN